MRFGVLAFSNEMNGGLVEAARHLEQDGYDSFCVADHIAGCGYSAFPMLAVLATVTTRMTLGTLVVPVAGRNSAQLAKDAWTIASLSSGRFVLGLGVGWNSAEFEAAALDFPALPDRWSQLEVAVARLTTLVTPIATGVPAVQGSGSQLPDGFPLVLGNGPMRVLVGGGGRYVLSRAGLLTSFVNIGDRLSTSGPAVPLEEKVGWVQDTRRHVGFPPADLSVLLLGVCVTDDCQAGYSVLAARASMPPEQLRNRYSIVVGSPAAIVQLIRSWEALGVQEIIVPLRHSLDFIRVIDMYRGGETSEPEQP